MIAIEDIYELPEGVTADFINPYFRLVIKWDGGFEEKLNLLLELSDKQWHTYSLLDYETRHFLDKWITSNWDFTSFNQAETITSIASLLGLEGVLVMSKEVLNENISEDVREEIESFIDELNENINDPYSGMRNIDKSSNTSST